MKYLPFKFLRTIQQAPKICDSYLAERSNTHHHPGTEQKHGDETCRHISVESGELIMLDNVDENVLTMGRRYCTSLAEYGVDLTARVSVGEQSAKKVGVPRRCEDVVDAATPISTQPPARKLDLRKRHDKQDNSPEVGVRCSARVPSISQLHLAVRPVDPA
jgi:hypothetical protein